MGEDQGGNPRVDLGVWQRGSTKGVVRSWCVARLPVGRRPSLAGQKLRAAARLRKRPSVRPRTSARRKM
jgi:hypothetical protein